MVVAIGSERRHRQSRPAPARGKTHPTAVEEGGSIHVRTPSGNPAKLSSMDLASEVVRI
jgi:hypothetical protein